MKFVWQIAYPLRMVQVWIAILVLKICFASPEIIGVKVYNRRADRETNSFTPYTEVCGFFLSVKFATSLLASLTGG